MKKLIIFSLVVGLFLSLGSATYAQAKGNAAKNTPQAVKAAPKQTTAVTTSSAEVKLSLHQRIWEKLKETFPNLLPAGVNRAEIVAISGTQLPATLTVSSEGKNLTLKLTEKSLLLRKFGGKAALSELKKGDQVSARGTWQDSSEAILEVRVLRDLSLQKRQATFWGKITAVAKDSFTLDIGKRGPLNVLVSSTTKIVDRREKTTSFASLVVGHRVRVTGLWDETAKQMDEVRTVKDWSLAPTPSAIPTPTIVPTVNPTP